MVERISLKIGLDSSISPEFHRDFLNDFYAAQRQHLEREALYGKRKDSKSDEPTVPRNLVKQRVPLMVKSPPQCSPVTSET